MFPLFKADNAPVAPTAMQKKTQEYTLAMQRLLTKRSLRDDLALTPTGPNDEDGAVGFERTAIEFAAKASSRSAAKERR